MYMEYYVTKQEIREINKKLFAYDYKQVKDGSREKISTEIIISNIIQKYNPEDALANVPIIIELEEEEINQEIVDKIYLLNNKSVYIQINSDILAKQDKFNLIKALKDANYKLVVEINKTDKIFTITKAVADIVKFDINNIPEAIMDNRADFQCKKLAYNVDEPELYALAESAGIELYAGKYISESTDIEFEANKHSKINFVELMSVINKSSSDMDEISRVIAKDCLISAQIIRLANSSYFKDEIRVNSIDEAVKKIGLTNLKNWMMLIQFSKSSVIPEELIRTSYYRALMCQNIYSITNTNKKKVTKNDMYFVGLFSLLDVLTGNTIEKELINMNINKVVTEALIYRDGIGGDILNIVKAYENADWDKIDYYGSKLGISKKKMDRVYKDTMEDVVKLWSRMGAKENLI